jgi:hypothetical protein
VDGASNVGKLTGLAEAPYARALFVLVDGPSRAFLGGSSHQRPFVSTGSLTAWIWEYLARVGQRRGEKDTNYPPWWQKSIQRSLYGEARRQLYPAAREAVRDSVPRRQPARDNLPVTAAATAATRWEGEGRPFPPSPLYSASSCPSAGVRAGGLAPWLAGGEITASNSPRQPTPGPA